MASNPRVVLGVKTDPVVYRYSFEWLFDLLASEEIPLVQLGSFFELYHIDNEYFTRLRQSAEDRGLRIQSVFTAHRELGGFFAGDPAWERVARRSYERLIEVGGLVGATHVGSNPGAVFRDRMHQKAAGIRCYLDHMKALTTFAHDRGVECLTIEPMSCLAEPPTTPDEIASMAVELANYHRATPDTARIGYCTDVSHGYADSNGHVQWAHLELLEATLPYLEEIHLKNTDAQYHATFGFSEDELQLGIVDLLEVKGLLESNADRLPRDVIPAFLELPGPKLGRDYSDKQLEDALRASLQYCKEVFNASQSIDESESDLEMYRAKRTTTDVKST